MSLGLWVLAILLTLVCVLLMLVILIQRGRGGGLSGAFGGAGGTSAFGAKTGDVFTWITVVVATVFVLLAVVANYAFDKSAEKKKVAPATATSAPEETPESTAPAPVEMPPVTTEPVEASQPTAAQPEASQPTDEETSGLPVTLPEEELSNPPTDVVPETADESGEEEDEGKNEEEEQPAP